MFCDDVQVRRALDLVQVSATPAKKKKKTPKNPDITMCCAYVQSGENLAILKFSIHILGG